jgi:hypothetical protein
MDFDPRARDEYFEDLEEPEGASPKKPVKKPEGVRPIFPPSTPDALTPEQVAGIVITYDDMRRALGKILKKRGMEEEEINHLAMYLLSFFGFSDAIIDNILDTEDRDVFYMLEEEGLLSTSREESYTIKGKIWRIHYWILKKREILMLAREAEAQQAKVKERGEFAVYDEVDPRVWAREE